MMKLLLRYLPSLRGWYPLDWRDAPVPGLAEAVAAFALGTETTEQFELVRAYCDYYILAVCFDSKVGACAHCHHLLAYLRGAVRTVPDGNHLWSWLNSAAGMSIRPIEAPDRPKA